MQAALITELAAHDVIVLDGCDGTGKTSLANALRERHGYALVHSGRTPDGIDLPGRYRQLLDTAGRVVLDRSFISELVYGPMFHDRSRISRSEAIDLARQAAAGGGVLVHLTADPDVIATRLQSRGDPAPPPGQIRGIVNAYHEVFSLLNRAAHVITVDTTDRFPW